MSVGAEQSEAKTRLPDVVELTKEGGNYYRAITFWYAITAVALPVVVVALLVSIINPFWFRDGFFRWAEHTVNKLARWRNYRQYAIYLGCDPEYWHTLASK